MGWFSVFLFMQGPRTITRDPSAAMPNQLPINGAQICILAHTHTHTSHKFSHKKQTKSAAFSSQNTIKDRTRRASNYPLWALFSILSQMKWIGFWLLAP
jgi:hypothetical protein